MTITYRGAESPISGDRPATSVADVDETVRDTVKNAITSADLTIKSLDHEIQNLSARRDRLAQHRTHLRAWLEETHPVRERRLHVNLTCADPAEEELG